MIEDFFKTIFQNPFTIFIFLIGVSGYIAINAFYTGNVWLLNLRVNSNTKKAKKLLEYGVYMTLFAFLALSFLVPYLSYRKTIDLSNPFIGLYRVESSGDSESIVGLYYLSIYINEDNELVGDFTRQDGKKLAYFRNSILIHTNYNKLSGDYSSELGERFHFSCESFGDEIECNLKEKESEIIIAIIEAVKN